MECISIWNKFSKIEKNIFFKSLYMSIFIFKLQFGYTLFNPPPQRGSNSYLKKLFFIFIRNTRNKFIKSTGN